MQINKNLSLFREFLKLKYKYAVIYANQVSKFSEKTLRKKAYTIKSDLAHNFDKDEFLYVPINLWRAITRIFKDFVIGMGFSVDFWNDEINNKFVEITDKLNLKIILDEAVNFQSAIWYSVLRVREKNGEPRVEIIPLPNYCANMSDLNIGDWFEDIKEHFIFSIQKDENGKKYLYVDRYEKTENWWMGYYGEKRDYNADFYFTNRIEEGVEEPLEDLPLFLINNDLMNYHIVDETYTTGVKSCWDVPRYFAQSDYVDLADLFQEINDRESQISVEMIKNLTSKISIPASAKDTILANNLRAKNNGKNFSENPDYLVHNPWEEPARYIQKDSEYLNVTIDKYIPMLLKMIWFVAGIPTALLYTAVYGWNAPVGTSDKERQIFYSRVESKQKRLYSSLQKMFVLLMKISWYNVEVPTIRFKKVAVYDVAERTTTAIQQMNAWIMSKSSAIQYIMGTDEVETQEELQKIEEETVESYRRDWSFLDFNNENDDEWATE